MTRVNTLTEIWNTYNENVISEKAPAMKAAKFGTKPGKGPKNLNDKNAGAFANDDTSGPGNAVGVMEEPYTVDDPQKEGGKEKKSVKVEQLNKKVGKKVKESINNYMKSTFDKLFENVMSDEEQGELEALGVDTEEVSEESGDTITVTLDKDMAKQLCDLLKDAMGEEDDDAAEDYEEMEEVDSEYEEDAEDGEDHDDKEDEEDEEVAQEAVDAEDHGHALVNQKDSGLTSTKNNKVGSLKTSKKKADAKVKKQDDGGSELSDAGGHSLTSTKNNKVGNLKVGADLFGD
jgi:hypothetical protein